MSQLLLVRGLVTATCFPSEKEKYVHSVCDEAFNSFTSLTLEA